MTRLRHRNPNRETTDPRDQVEPARPGLLVRLLLVGPLVFLLAGAVMGMLGIHGTGDTWIGLATGRYIIEHGEVPLTDPFSFTFADHPFFNQNWLTQVIFFCLYDRIAPAAVVIFIWLLDATVYALVLYSVRVRTRSWMAALLATGVAAAVSRHYLDVRAVTVGYTCLAITCAILHYFSAFRGRQRWWPALLLLPILLVWGDAHGSFVFGYGLLGLFAAWWVAGQLLGRLLQRRGTRERATPGLWRRLVNSLAVPATRAQILAMVSTSLVALILTAWLGPYGVANFTHPLVVGESKVFRNIAEWNPPWVRVGRGLEVWPFWTALAIAGFSAIVAASVWLLARAGTDTPAQRAEHRVRTTLFDLALVALGLWMAIFARRFAPLFYILATPVVAIWIVRLTAGVVGKVRNVFRLSLATAAWLAAISLVALAGTMAHKELIVPYAKRPGFNLLQRFVQYDAMPLDSMDFLRQTDVDIKILSEWTIAGPVMFELPRARVFVDGRSQQVYSEAHYLLATSLFDPGRFDAAHALQVLDQSGTDTVLLRRGQYGTAPLGQALYSSRDWMPVLITPDSTVYLRRNSVVLAKVRALEQEGRLRWPPFAESTATRGLLWAQTAPPNYEQSLVYLRSAAERDARVGLLVYRAILDAWLRLGRSNEAAAYFEQERARILDRQLPIDNDLRGAMLKLLDECLRQLRPGAAGAGQGRP